MLGFRKDFKKSSSVGYGCWQICAHERKCVVNYSTSCSQYDMHVLKCKLLQNQQPTSLHHLAFVNKQAQQKYLCVTWYTGKHFLKMFRRFDVFGPNSCALVPDSPTQGSCIKQHSIQKESFLRRCKWIQSSSSSSSSSSTTSRYMLCFKQVWRQFTIVRWKCTMLRGSLSIWPSSGQSCRVQLASTFTSRLRSSALCWKCTLAMTQ